MIQQIKSFVKEHHIIKQHALLISYSIIIVLVVMLIITNFRIVGSPISKKIDTYYYTWVDFQRMTGQDLHILWAKKFYYATYQLDGNAKGGRYDCFSAPLEVLTGFGANIKLQKVEDFNKTLQEKSKARLSWNEVKEKDLIVFRINADNWHLGIVSKVVGGKIYYCDMHTPDGVGLNQMVQFGYYTIKGIYPITLNLWMGDLLKNI
jgi:hypothetical protein